MKSKYDFPEGYRYYDEGWNARIAQQPFESNASIDWADGWMGCEEAFQGNENPTFID